MEFDPTVFVRKPLEWLGTALVWIGVAFWAVSKKLGPNDEARAEVRIIRGGQG